MGNNINYGKVKITKDEFYYLFCSAYAKLKNGKKLEGPELYIIKKYFELERDEGWSQRRIADFWHTNVMKVNRILNGKYDK